MNNLLSNAVKYSPEKSKVFIKILYIGDNYMIQVSDCGIGIPEEDLNLLFEPFHRSRNVSTLPGTGLGLTISKRYVEALQGTISVCSELNSGTTFIITLPKIYMEKKPNLK